ncbi:MAG: hypothetical protein ACRELB_27205 [Polyangiaceae bacterium]
MPWKKKNDPLFRGDAATGVALPDPAADLSIVEHILYLGGAGRPSRYQSTTEAEEIAGHFAGSAGKVYRTMASRAEANGVRHLGNVELKALLRGKGYGGAKGSNALLVMQARRFAEQWAEHLFDFTDVPAAVVDSVVKDIYEP